MQRDILSFVIFSTWQSFSLIQFFPTIMPLHNMCIRRFYFFIPLWFRCFFFHVRCLFVCVVWLVCVCVCVRVYFPFAFVVDVISVFLSLPCSLSSPSIYCSLLQYDNRNHVFLLLLRIPETSFLFAIFFSVIYVDVEAVFFVYHSNENACTLPISVEW